MGNTVCVAHTSERAKKRTGQLECPEERELEDQRTGQQRRRLAEISRQSIIGKIQSSISRERIPVNERTGKSGMSSGT